MNKIILAIIQAVLTQALGKGISSDQARMNEAADVLVRKIAAMPFILRKAMTVLTHVFNWHGLTHRCLFAAQGLEARQRQLQQWKKSPVGPCREFVGFYEKMSVFIYLSLCENN